MFRLVHVREHERGLWFRRGDFQDLILPGSTWLLNWQDRILIVDTLNPRFEHPLLDLLIEKPALRNHLEVVDLGELERAIVWKDGKFLTILGPGRHAFWKTAAKLEIETHSLDGLGECAQSATSAGNALALML